MNFQVTARKWRPMVFEDVVGQSHVTSTLRNALATNRVAHAYIFSGTRGCGKTTTARILARALNCLSPKDQNPDNTCDVCQEITSGRSLDVIEIDGASNRGVEEIRNLRESVRYAPTRAKFKLYIIDEVHMLTKEAFNALLKTLEEPPSHAIFVFATTEIHKVPMTILSRCQRFDFRRIATEEIVARLTYIAAEEKVTIGEDALTVIAKKGDGSMRDAQSIFDQVRAFCGSTIATMDVLRALNAVDQEVFFKFSAVVLSKDAPGALARVDEVVKSGYDLREFVGGLAEHFRNLLIVRASGSTDLVEMSATYKKRYEEEAGRFSEADLLRILKHVHELESSLRFASQPRYKLEAVILQLARMESSVKIEELIHRLDDLKKNLGASSASSSTGPTKAVSPVPTSEVRVVGSVNAGPMTAPAAVKYSAFFGKPAWSRASASEHTVSPSSLPAAGQMPAASREQIIARWDEVVGDVLRTRIAVGTTLSESRLLDVDNGLLRIACPDEYHVSTLQKHKEYLADTVFRLVGARVLVEPVLSDGRKSVITYTPVQESERKSVIVTALQPPTEQETKDHPVLAALKRELGAERVD
ncbi:MAG: DNA polymerase III, subunit gamma and tau [Ignavibacteria bacterium RIFCSPLOWO2_12_FULL_56_21]|nr:MAG: DNA polymerase III, subunit gamma and tau [Ignavibacteria bacterium RIFCSPLOWO2_12_FULL_56_21]